jgi:hypothetical protein
MALIIMTLSIMKLILMILSVLTLYKITLTMIKIAIMTLSKMTLGKNYTEHNITHTMTLTITILGIMKQPNDNMYYDSLNDLFIIMTLTVMTLTMCPIHSNALFSKLT